MGILSLAGIRLPRPGDDTVADRKIRQALESSACAHRSLRHSLQTDPKFAGIICRALGCSQDGCGSPLALAASPLPVVEARAERMTDIAAKLKPEPASVMSPKKAAGPAGAAGGRVVLFPPRA